METSDDPKFNTDFYKLFKRLKSLADLPVENLKPASKPPFLSPKEREMLKMFLWQELCHYLSYSFSFNKRKETDMFNPVEIRALIIQLMENDTLDGIASITRVHVDILMDILSGKNTNPSIAVSFALIKYYIEVQRCDEYTEFMRKIYQWAEYLQLYLKFLKEGLTDEQTGQRGGARALPYTRQTNPFFAMYPSPCKVFLGRKSKNATEFSVKKIIDED
jgi:hypothetical protein